MSTRLRRAALAGLAGVVAVLTLGVGTASAHVSVSSPDATPGGFGEITFRVPTESDTASTVGLQMQLPKNAPIASVGIKPVPGWTATTTTTHLDQPIKTDDGTVADVVSQITWTAASGAGIAPGQYQTFSISAGPLPKATTLAFPTIQTYSDGSTVSWIDPTVKGQPEAQHPALTLTLSSASGDTAPAAATPASNGTSGLALAALIVGVVGLLVGAAGVALALGARRRATASTASPRDRTTADV